MHEQVSLAAVEEQVLAAPANGHHLLAPQAARKVARHRPAQVRIAHDHVADAPARPGGATIRAASSRLRATPAWRVGRRWVSGSIIRADPAARNRPQAAPSASGIAPRRSLANRSMIGASGRRLGACGRTVVSRIPAGAALLLAVARVAIMPVRAEDLGDTVAEDGASIDIGCDVRIPGCGDRGAARRHGRRHRDLRAPRPRDCSDPRIAKRAVETAIRARAFGPAMESASLLLELDPDSALAREIMAALLANEGDLDKARDSIAAVLAKAQNRGPILIAALAAVRQVPGQGRGPRRRAPGSPRNTPMPNRATPWASPRSSRARPTTRSPKPMTAALKMKPGWEQAAILKAQVLRAHGARPGDPVLPGLRRGESRRERGAHAAGPRARRRPPARRGARPVRRGGEALEERFAGVLRRGPALAAARGLSAGAGRVRPRAQGELPRAHRGVPGPGPGRRGPQAIRRGDPLVPEGRIGRLDPRAAQDRHAHRAPAGPRRGARIPAAHRGALRRRQHPDDPGRGAAAARREGVAGQPTRC